jgi:integrase/recombinase XerD
LSTAGECGRCGRPSVPGGGYCPYCGTALSAAGSNGEGPADHAELSAGTDVAIAPVIEIGSGRRGRAGRRATTRTARESSPDLLGVLEGGSRSEQRRAVGAGLLALARGGRRLDRARGPSQAAASFLRRFEGRRLTQAAYALDLADWLVWLDRAGIHPFETTFATVESYAREPLENGNPPAPATTARRLACLASFYRRALFAGLVDRNPVDQVQRPRVPNQSATLGISKQRANQLIRAARASCSTDTLLVLLMLELGLRVSETVAAEIEDLSEQGRHQVLRIRGKGQATKATIVPLNPIVAEAVADATAGRITGRLLLNEHGLPLSRQQAGRRIKQLGAQIGLPELHPHALRHAFVTLALDEGASLRDVQDGARHQDPRTTRRYDRNRMNLDRHPTHLLGAVLEQ